MRCLLALLGVALVGVVNGLPRQPANGHVLHERGLPHWRHTWTRRDRLPQNGVLPMRIGLKQANLELGHARLMEISNPGSPDYGNHMSSEEVTEMFSPPVEAVQAVRDWVVASGIKEDRVSQSTNKQWIQFDATVAEVERLLSAEYYFFEHARSGTKNIACHEYYLPSYIQAHVDYITPGIRLRHDGKRRKVAKRKFHGRIVAGRVADKMRAGPIRAPNRALADLPPMNATNCNAYVTPECVRTQYGVPKGSKAAPGNELGIFESLNDHYSKDDLDVYFSTMYPNIPNGTYPTEKLIDGANGAASRPDQIGGESNLDFQAAYPLIWPQKAILFQTDDDYYENNMTLEHTIYNGFLNTFLDALDGSYCTSTAYGETGNCVKPECLDPVYPNPNPGGYNGSLQCGVYKPTNVISISYGGGEADVPAYYLKRQCDEVMKLVLQGVTVVVSSGDYGVGSFPKDGGWATGCAGVDGKVFYPATSATCPYVLTVGSTQLDNVTTADHWTPGTPMPESATQSFASGGGFSNYFPVPDYQKQAVSTYFKSANFSFRGYTDMGTNFSAVGGGVYNVGGRGYPDVAAIGSRYVVRWNETWNSFGGTSLSAPIWASLLTLVNEERIAIGKKTVGFVNPVLYSHPEIFSDITRGSNPNCNSTGFPATQGWDPVTGLGTPIFPKLLKVFLDL